MRIASANISKGGPGDPIDESGNFNSSNMPEPSRMKMTIGKKQSTQNASNVTPNSLTGDQSAIDGWDHSPDQRGLQRENTMTGNEDNEKEGEARMQRGLEHYQYKEVGVMAQCSKGQTLTGAAYTGYDTNYDFKVRDEFKSPAMFASQHESRTYFFTRLLEMMFRQLESRTNKNTSFNLIYIYFHFMYQHNVYLSINTLVKLSRALRRSFL